MESEMSPALRRSFLVALAVLIGFSVLAKSAHDIWAATAVYLALLLLTAAYLVLAANKPVRMPLIGFSTAVLAVFWTSFHFSANPSESYLAFMDWVSFFTIFSLAVNLIKSEGDLLFLMALLVPVIGAEFCALWRNWLINTYKLRHGLLDYVEPVGTFVNANAAVAWLLLWFPFLFHKACTSATRRWYWAVGATASALGLLLIASTWSLICLMAGGAIYFRKQLWDLYIKRRRMFLIAVTGLGAIAGFVLLNKLAITLGWGGLAPRRLQPTSRLGWWMAAVKMWRNYPWLGVGLGNYPSAYLAYKSPAGLNTLYAHGLGFEILAETGILGVLAIVTWAGAFVMAIRKSIGQNRELLVGVLMFVLYSMINVSLEYLSNLLAFGVVLAALLQTENGFKWRPRVSVRLILVLGALAAIPFLVSPFLASRLIVDGNANVMSRDYEAAEKSYRAAIELDDRPWEPYFGLARIARARGHLDQVTRYAGEALSRNRLDVQLRRSLGESKPVALTP
jgi:O-antigen ligase